MHKGHEVHCLAGRNGDENKRNNLRNGLWLANEIRVPSSQQRRKGRTIRRLFEDEPGVLDKTRKSGFRFSLLLFRDGSTLATGECAGRASVVRVAVSFSLCLSTTLKSTIGVQGKGRNEQEKEFAKCKPGKDER